jgi:hypothetical protein
MISAHGPSAQGCAAKRPTAEGLPVAILARPLVARVKAFAAAEVKRRGSRLRSLGGGRRFAAAVLITLQQEVRHCLLLRDRHLSTHARSCIGFLSTKIFFSHNHFTTNSGDHARILDKCWTHGRKEKLSH